MTIAFADQAAGRVDNLAAGAPQVRELSPSAIEWAQHRVLGDMDDFADTLGAAAMHRTSCEDEADRALRMPHRLEGAPLEVVMCAALICAHEGNRDECFRAMQIMAQRHLQANAARVIELASEE